MTTDTQKRPEGHVVFRFENRLGDRVLVADKHNVTTYSASDAVAMAYAGDSSYIPSKIAFIYGNSGNDTINSIDKTTSWTDVEKECNDNTNLNFVITSFSYQPTVASSDESKYSSNLVTFHGRTENIPDGSYVYKACLLGKGTNGATYNLLAAVDLGSAGEYRAKPESFELSVDWSVKFN